MAGRLAPPFARQLFELPRPLVPFLDERRAPVPERFAEEVRLDAAAARFMPFADPFAERFADPLTPVRDPLLADALVLPRLDERAGDFEAFRDDFAAPRVDAREADFALPFLAALFLAVAFVPRFAAAFVPVRFALVFLAAVLFAPVFLAPALLAPVLRAAVLRAAVFLAPAFLAPPRLDALAPVFFAADLAPFLAELREDVFAADLRPDFAAAVFLVPVFRAPVEALLRDDEVLRLRGVLVAADSVSPLPEDMPPSLSFCMVFDLSSVAIDRLLTRGLAFRPSRLP